MEQKARTGMNSWLARITERVEAEGRIARITILAARGPTPREIGATMLVTGHGREGKIGRGPLEAQAVALAREILAGAGASDRAPAWLRHVREFATGDVLGSSSGGAISVLIEVLGPAELEHLGPIEPGAVLARPLASGAAGHLLAPDSAPRGLAPEIADALTQLRHDPHLSRRLVEGPQGPWLIERLAAPAIPFYVYGTGLVARALIEKLAGLPFHAICVDTDAARLTSALPRHARALPTPDPAALAMAAPPGSFHVVMSQSHELDYAIAKALMTGARFGHLGMIGSRMKRKRLEAMLERDGIPSAVRARLVCPVGLPAIKSKVPAVIAIAIAAEALIALQRLKDASDHAAGSNA